VARRAIRAACPDRLLVCLVTLFPDYDFVPSNAIVELTD
jgi:hypothetical protein